MLQFLHEKIVEHMYHFELDLPTLLHSKSKTINLNNFVKKKKRILTNFLALCSNKE